MQIAHMTPSCNRAILPNLSLFGARALSSSETAASSFLITRQTLYEAASFCLEPRVGLIANRARPLQRNFQYSLTAGNPLERSNPLAESAVSCRPSLDLAAAGGRETSHRCARDMRCRSTFDFEQLLLIVQSPVVSISDPSEQTHDALSSFVHPRSATMSAPLH